MELPSLQLARLLLYLRNMWIINAINLVMSWFLMVILMACKGWGGDIYHNIYISIEESTQRIVTFLNRIQTLHQSKLIILQTVTRRIWLRSYLECQQLGIAILSSNRIYILPFAGSPAPETKSMGRASQNIILRVECCCFLFQVYGCSTIKTSCTTTTTSHSTCELWHMNPRSTTRLRSSSLRVATFRDHEHANDLVNSPMNFSAVY